LLLLLALASNKAYLAEAATTNYEFTPFFFVFLHSVSLQLGTGHEPFKPPIRNATTAASAALPAGGGALCPFLQASAHPY
jgi:hypothetical protein